MDAVNDQAAWDEAAERVMAYLACLEIGGVEHRAREALQVIEHARARCLADPALHPMEAAMTEALRKWQGTVPAGVPVSAAPELALSSMAARDMNFGAMETIAQETWQKFYWGPVLRAAAFWTAVFFFALYAYDRFFAP